MRKRRYVYLGLLCISIFIIYAVLYMDKREYIVDGVIQRGTTILSIGQYLYMVLGLLAVAFSLHLYSSMISYQVGKIFTIYISCVAATICMIAVSNFRYTSINALITIMSVASNGILFYLINYLILGNKKGWIKKIYIFGAITITAIFIIFLRNSFFDNRDILGRYVLAEYVFTILISSINLGMSYKRATKYAMAQIKILLAGIVAGVILLCASHAFPLVTIVEIPSHEVINRENSVRSTEGSIISIENEMKTNMDAIIGFSGIIVTIIYILVQREYLIMERNWKLKYYLGSVTYLIVANTVFRFFMSGNRLEFIATNFLLILPLCFFELHRSNKGQESYNDHLLEILEEERSRISIYLHDEILQRLIVVSHLSKDKQANKELTSIISDIRNVSQNLYPTIAEDLGLEEALRVLIDEAIIDHNVEIEYQYQYPSGMLPKGMALTLYRVTKELLMNAIKHSESPYISVEISKINNGIQCVVADKGKGFQILEDTELLRSPHMGLYTVKKQVSERNGSMQITSDSTGSQFKIYIPME